MDKVKKQLNILIEYYRKKHYEKTGDKGFSKELFPTVLIDHQQMSICSATTYRKMVNNKIVKNDDIYIELLNKLNLYYDEHAFVYETTFLTLCEEILTAQENFQSELQLKLIKNVMNQINGNDVIEKEYFYVFTLLYEMVEKGHWVCDTKLMKHVIEVFEIFNQPLKQCLATALYNYCVKMHLEIKVPYYFAMIDNTPYQRTHNLYFMIDAGVELDEVDNEMNWLINYYMDRKNYNQVLNMLIMNMKYYYQIGKDSNEALKEVDEFIAKYESFLSEKMKLSYLYFKAKKFNREKHYAIAKPLFEELLRRDVDYINYVLDFYFTCLIMLDEHVNYDESIASILSGRDALIYQYFQIDKDYYIERENYILNNLCNQHILNEYYIVKSFLKELRRIVKVTKHYSKLEKYLEKTDEFL